MSGSIVRSSPVSWMRADNAVRYASSRFAASAVSGWPYAASASLAALFVPKGYAYARADVRGTYNSGGCWDYGGIKERQDGYDLVEWLGTRGWSNGKVAMTGGSYDGTTANAAAVENPPHLATIVPVSAISRWWGYAYQQGTRSSYSGESADIDPPSEGYIG